MPLRFLVYAGMVYSSYIENKVNKINIYSSKQQKLPIPKLICFYNGVQDRADCTELNLSTAFPEGSDPDINVKVKMLNINFGRNMELLNACQPLWDYSWLIDKIIQYKKETGSVEEAVDRAVDDLPEKSVIKGFLLENKAEVKRMCITEYDEAWTMNLFKEEGREEGRILQAIKMYQVLAHYTEKQVLEAIRKDFNLSEQDAEKYMELEKEAAPA